MQKDIVFELCRVIPLWRMGAELYFRTSEVSQVDKICRIVCILWRLMLLGVLEEKCWKNEECWSNVLNRFYNAVSNIFQPGNGGKNGWKFVDVISEQPQHIQKHLYKQNKIKPFSNFQDGRAGIIIYTSPPLHPIFSPQDAYLHSASTSSKIVWRNWCVNYRLDYYDSRWCAFGNKKSFLSVENFYPGVPVFHV